MLRTGSGSTGGGRLTYAEITPGRWLRSYRLSLFGFNRFRHEALDDASSRNHWMEARDGAEGTASGNFTFLNYWNVNLGFRYKPELLSSTMTRGGPLMVEPATRRLEAAVTSDRRRRFSVRPWINHRTGRAGGGITDTGIDLSFRPADRIRITLDPTYSSALDVAQYVARFADPGFEATYGERYLFSDLRRQTLSVDTRLDVVFSPRMSLQFFAQPLVSSGEYQSYKQLMHSSSFDFERLTEGSFFEAKESASCAGGRTCVHEGVRYLDLEGDGVASRSIADRDFLIRSLRSSAVLRWEYRPGSVAYLVWQHGRLLRENKHGLAAGDLGRIFDAPMENILIVKLNYWLGI